MGDGIGIGVFGNVADLVGVKGFQYLLPQREKAGSGTLKTVMWGSF